MVGLAIYINNFLAIRNVLCRPRSFLRSVKCLIEDVVAEVIDQPQPKHCYRDVTLLELQTDGPYLATTIYSFHSLYFFGLQVVLGLEVGGLEPIAKLKLNGGKGAQVKLPDFIPD